MVQVIFTPLTEISAVYRVVGPEVFLKFSIPKVTVEVLSIMMQNINVSHIRVKNRREPCLRDYL